MKLPSYYINKYKEFDEKHGFSYTAEDLNADILVGEVLTYADSIGNALYTFNNYKSDNLTPMEIEAQKILKKYEELVWNHNEIELLEIALKHGEIKGE